MGQVGVDAAELRQRAHQVERAGAPVCDAAGELAGVVRDLGAASGSEVVRHAAQSCARELGAWLSVAGTAGVQLGRQLAAAADLYEQVDAQSARSFAEGRRPA